MSRLNVSDVVVRARGIERHLLDPQALRQLARSSGLGVLAGALQRAGYWPAPSGGMPALSAAQLIESAIEHEIVQRFGVLARWLGDRTRSFAAVFEDEERRTLRMRMRALAAISTPPVDWGSAWLPSSRIRSLVARATDLAELVGALTRANHPYAAPIASARRESGDDVRSLERALDRTYAARAVASASRIGGPLLDWVEQGIDLENAWDALAGGGDGGTFLPGGSRLGHQQCRRVTAAPELSERRRLLADVFARSPFAGPFADPTIPLENLEAKAQAARAYAMRDYARIDPLSAAPILWVVMRLRQERANLRCISWGVAQGLPFDSIVGGMAEVA